VASPISIDVVVTKNGHDVSREDVGSTITKNPYDKEPIDHVQSRFSYVLFPLRESKKEDVPTNSPVVAKFALQFELRIRYTTAPHVNMQDEIDAALWAWELFGGVGARTRRGCGSIQSLDNQKRIDEIISEGIKRFLPGSQGGNWPAHVPSLQGLTASQEYQLNRASVAWTRMQDQNPINAWLNMVDMFKLQVRQARKTEGRKNNIGPSLWFEADMLRNIFAIQSGVSRFNKGDSTQAQTNIFARLQLGAPMEISFINKNHFRRDDSNKYKYIVSVDEQNELRVPSPLIFRVWRSPNGSIYQIVLVMGGLRTPENAFVQSAQLPYSESVKTRGVGSAMLHNRRRADFNDVLRVAFEVLKGNQQ
jgi:CRISPR-associated protein Cmr1